MKWDRVQVNWKQLSGRVRERWDRLTAEELERIGGERERLEGSLRREYGLAEDEAKKDVDEFCRSL